MWIPRGYSRMTDQGFIAVKCSTMMMDNDGFSRFLRPFQLTFPVFLEAPHDYLYRIPMFFKPLSLWSWISFSRHLSDHHSRLLLVVSVGLSHLGSSLLLSSLVWYVFLLLPLFTFSCSRFRGSLVVIVCLIFLTFLARILSSAL